MVCIEAEKENGTIIISEDSFDHLLNCLANQKFVGETPPNGDAAAMDPNDYRQVHVDIQAAIDDCYRQCRAVLHN